jgi:hypothetical protein
LTVKCRLGQTALPEPELTVAGKQPVSGQPAHRANDDSRLAIVHVPRVEDVLHGFGMRDQIAVHPRQEMQADTVPVLLPGVVMEAQGIALNVARTSPEPMAAHARWHIASSVRVRRSALRFSGEPVRELLPPRHVHRPRALVA